MMLTLLRSVRRRGFAVARRAAIGVLLGAACGPFSQAEAASAESSGTVRVTPDQTQQLKVVPAQVSSFVTHKAAVGQIAFNEDASTIVLSPFSGRVTRLLAKQGEDVKRGDPLFEIDSPEVVQAQTDLIAAVHAVDKAKAQVALAKRVLDRQTALLADRATAMREVDQARNDHTAAESDLATAQGSLTAARNRLRVIIGRETREVERVERERIVNPLITVNAPIDGTVISRKIGPGQYVRSDGTEPLYAIADLSTMWLKAFVPEADISHVRVGQEVEVKVTALPNLIFRARVIAIGAASDQLTRRVVVRSEIPNPDRMLKAEMFATFKIAVGEPEQALVVPTEAVVREGELATVWVQQEPLVFERRRVKLGTELDARVQIREGVKAGETVVGRGAIFLDNEAQQ
jgi:cobalt-zinc-cadmium efflux system membrane fusion protein